MVRKKSSEASGVLGALERVNDAFLDAYGLLFIEVEDPAQVNAEVLGKLEA